jgi:hypothetical protein
MYSLAATGFDSENKAGDKVMPYTVLNLLNKELQSSK